MSYEELYIIYALSSVVAFSCLMNAAISWQNIGTRRGSILVACGVVCGVVAVACLYRAACCL